MDCRAASPQPISVPSGTLACKPQPLQALNSDPYHPGSVGLSCHFGYATSHSGPESAPRNKAKANSGAYPFCHGSQSGLPGVECLKTATAHVLCHFTVADGRKSAHGRSASRKWKCPPSSSRFHPRAVTTSTRHLSSSPTVLSFHLEGTR